MALRTQWRAGGNIPIRSIVVVNASATVGDEVVVSGTNTKSPVGVSDEGADRPPLPGNTVYAAQVGEPVRVYGVGEVTTVTLGTGGCTVNDFLKSDTNGAAVTAPVGAGNTTIQYVLGIALETASAGEAVPVLVMPQCLLASIT